MLTVILIALVGAGLIGWRFVARQRRQRAILAAVQNRTRSYHSVEVLAGFYSCGAAQQLAHARFLSDEAPSLPVPGCRVERCTCRYIHHDDRREDDRRNPYGRARAMPPAIAGERRAKRDRRRAQDNLLRPAIAH